MIKKCCYGILISLILIIRSVHCGMFGSVSRWYNNSPNNCSIKCKIHCRRYHWKNSIATENMVYVITKYDSSTDQYTRQLLYKNPDGSWGHFINNKTGEKVERTLVEKVYPVKISHVNIASIPIITPTVPPTVTTCAFRKYTRHIRYFPSDRRHECDRECNDYRG